MNAIILNPTGVIGTYDYTPLLIDRGIINMYCGLFSCIKGAEFNWIDIRDVTLTAVDTISKGIAGERYILVVDGILYMI